MRQVMISYTNRWIDKVKEKRAPYTAFVSLDRKYVFFAGDPRAVKHLAGTLYSADTSRNSGMLVTPCGVGCLVDFEHEQNKNLLPSAHGTDGICAECAESWEYVEDAIEEFFNE